MLPEGIRILMMGATIAQGFDKQVVLGARWVSLKNIHQVGLRNDRRQIQSATRSGGKQFLGQGRLAITEIRLDKLFSVF